MKNEFIHANEIVREKSIDEKKIEDFISTFNKKLKKHSGKALTSKVSINDGLDEIPTLTDAEFEEVKKRAATAGWIFTSSPDNYGTTSYHLEMKRMKDLSSNLLQHRKIYLFNLNFKTNSKFHHLQKRFYLSSEKIFAYQQTKKGNEE